MTWSAEQNWPALTVGATLPIMKDCTRSELLDTEMPRLIQRLKRFHG